MTTVIVCKYGDGESLAVSDGLRSSKYGEILSRRIQKVFRVKSYLVGLSGEEDFCERVRRWSNDDGWAYTNDCSFPGSYLAEMKKMLVEAGAVMPVPEEGYLFPRPTVSVLVSTDKGIFRISSSLYPVSCDSWFDCAGSGAVYAAGAMHVQYENHDGPPRDLEQAARWAARAMSSAFEFDCFTGGMVTMVSSEGLMAQYGLPVSAPEFYEIPEGS